MRDFMYTSVAPRASAAAVLRRSPDASAQGGGSAAAGAGHDFATLSVHAPDAGPGGMAEEECKGGVLGGEVNNDSDVAWWISGCQNSRKKDFVSLAAGENSDSLAYVTTFLKGDVDAVWPAGRSIKNAGTGDVVTDGAFKLSSHRNTDIEGDVKSGYTISDFSAYFAPGSLPKGWGFPA